MYFSTIGLSVLEASRTSTPSDGITDASSQLDALIRTGKDIALEPGKTYLVSRPLTLRPGQILHGNSATLKRAAQVSSPTATPTTSGVTTTITVANASLFAVGMSVVLVNGANYDAGQHVITAISGNDITVNTPWLVTFSGTSVLYQGGNLLVASDDCRVFHLNIDGNRANWTFAKWYHTTDLRFGGSRVLFEGCHVQNSPGEAIQASASVDDLRLSFCRVTNSNGNGIHLGGNNRVRITFSAFVNCNLNAAVEHADGCIAWSDTIADCLVLGCYMENGKSGIGSIDQSDNSDLTVIGCEIRNCTVSAIEANCSSDLGTSRALFLGNRISDSVAVLISSGRSLPAEYPNRFVFVGNAFVNTRFSAIKATHLLVEGNDFASAADITSNLVYLENCQDSTVVGNTILGGSRGIGVDGSASQDIALTRNRITGQKDRGIEVMGSAVGCDGIDIEHNTIRNGAAAISTYDGIIGRSKTRIHGNRVIIGGLGHAGIYPQNGCIVDDNHVRQGSATYSIRADGGTSGIIVQNNYYTSDAPSNGAGVANTFQNNLLTA